MKNALPPFLLFLILLSSCRKEAIEVTFPQRMDVPVLLGTQSHSYDSNRIDFSFDLAVFRGDNEINSVEDFTGLPDSSFRFTDFEFSGTWVNYFVDEVEYLSIDEESEFTTTVLIDQSAWPENFDSTDYFNQRFQAFHAFYKNLNGKGRVKFASYSRTGDEHQVVEWLNDKYHETWELQTLKDLLDLTHLQEGTSGLFDALEETIGRMSDEDFPNKSITVFLRNKDDGKSQKNLNSIIDLARAAQIRVNLIWLIHDPNNVDFPTLRKLAVKTGGFQVYLSKIDQSTTVFLKLPDILNRNLEHYRVRGHVTVGQPNYFSPSFGTGVYLYYYVSKYFKWSYVPLYFEKP